MSSRTQPSRAGYLVGLLLILAAGLAILVGTGLGAKAYVDGAQKAPRGEVPSISTVQLKKDDTRSVIALAPTTQEASAVTVTIAGPADLAVTLDKGSAAALGEIDRLQTRVVGTFSAPQDGTYTVTASGPSTAKVAVSTASPTDTLPWLVGGFIAGGLLGLIGLVLLIRTAVRRRR